MAYLSPEFFLREAAKTASEIQPEAGHSGFFSTPQPDLDPDLFHGDRIKDDVRSTILSPLDSWFRSKGLADWRSWCRVWLAGSGISYQWAGDRGNGDLDVLIGVDPLKLRRAFPNFSGLSDTETAAQLNALFHAELWPVTAQTKIGGKYFEITYYWNPGVTDAKGSIRSINPYAAYDLSDCSWTVRPPKLPENPASMYPKEWHQAVEREAQLAREIISRFNAARAQVLASHGPMQTNALTLMRLAASQAAALYDDIHLGRKAAFRQGGEGYRDWANFRWQSHKAKGTAQALAQVRHLADEAAAKASAAMYGAPLDDAETARVKAIQWTHARGML